MSKMQKCLNFVLRCKFSCAFIKFDLRLFSAVLSYQIVFFYFLAFYQLQMEFTLKFFVELLSLKHHSVCQVENHNSI